jgi:peptidoglycan lytic transglycosylase A
MRTGQIIRRTLKKYVLLVAALGISACATTNTSILDSGQKPDPAASPSSVPQELAQAPLAKPEPIDPPALSTEAAPPSEHVSEPISEHISGLVSKQGSVVEHDVETDTETEIETASEANLDAHPEEDLKPGDISVPSGAFSELKLWQAADPAPALKAFKKTCEMWKRKPDEKWLKPTLPMFGKYKDWRAACHAAHGIEMDRNNAVRFFQSYFEPIDIGHDTGLLTAYYAPEIPVRRHASLEFSEPILARPHDAKKQTLARKDISTATSKVLAYGRPVDVFFMQIQGSGQIKFPDGTLYRAAFDGHNGHKYKSIGRVLLKRGDLSADKASKQDIEDWMARAGYEKTRQLMAENPRYIFFKTEYIVPGVGPRGSSGVTLTAMGSIAIEPKYYPYGALIWVEGKFPTKAGDYTGTQSGKLLVAQDMGGAIKGKKRGDVFFGSGDAAGAKAGVMKHRATWTLFLPVALALKQLPAS